MDNFQKHLGVIADIIGVGTFIASFFSISKPVNIIWIDALGVPISTSRLLLSSILVFSSAYALSKLFGKLMTHFYDSDKPFRILIYGVTGAIAAWLTLFVLQYLLYGPALDIGYGYRIGFTLLVALCCWANNYFLGLQIEKHPDYKDEFENSFTPILILQYAIFWFKPVFSAFSN